MKTIAFVTQKGGAGKTTLAAALAVAASEAGERVAALDLDPQGSLIAWGNDRAAEAPAVDSLTGDLINRLPDVLKALAARGFTLVILDCPGVASTSINLAIKAADLCLIPSRPTRVDLRATKPTVSAVTALGRPFAFVLNQCAAGKSSRANEAAAGLHMLGALADPMVAQRADYQDALAAGQGVTEYNPTGKAAEEARALWAWASKALKHETAIAS